VNQPKRSHRNGGRRVSPRTYRFLLAAHIVVSVSWLGVVIGKLALGVAAVLSDTATLATQRFGATGVLDLAFRPLAILTVLTGVALSLGTKWGLLRYFWVATKLVLTVGVIGSAVPLADRLARAVIASTSGGSVGGTAGAGAVLSLLATPTTLFVGLTVAHLTMLLVATVLSVYKPWGRTRFGRRSGTVPVPRRSRDGDAGERHLTRTAPSPVRRS
jgi:hypothetical protein